ncbi:MAG: hypothetical protein JXQ76_08870, partial [Campylobacterales bacterium]|nr:hypothetical protein [Campylobacterales bacterium]
LTQRKLSDKEERELYLIANESEYIRIDYNLVELYEDDKKRHIEKLHRDVEHLVNYISGAKKLLNHELDEDLYIDLYQHFFFALYEVSKQVQTNQNYFRYNQRLMTKHFLKIIAKRENAQCNIVYPTYEKELSLFDEYDKTSIEYVELNLDLALEKKVKMNRIFIVESRAAMSRYCIEILKQFVEVGINVKIALKSDVERLRLSSYDLIYDIDVNKEGKITPRNYALYRNDIEKRSIFKVTQNKTKIIEMHHNFQKIDAVSTPFEQFMQTPQTTAETIEDAVLRKLMGEWYLYSHRSNILKDNKPVIGYAKLTIKANREVWYVRHTLNDKETNVVKRKGTIDTHSYPHQSVLMLTNLASSELSIISINNKDKHKNILKVSAISKAYGNENDILGFGILSRFELDESMVSKTLGDIHNTTLQATHELDESINQLDINYKSKPLYNKNDWIYYFDETTPDKIQ